MNPKPHMHEVEIRNYCDGNSQRIQYGDTRVIVHAFFFGRLPSPRRIDRAVRKAVKRHDKGSIKHAKYEASLQKINQHIKKEPERTYDSNGNVTYESNVYFRTISPDRWASELMKAKND